VKYGNGYEGWSEFAPYDRIIVTCAPEDVPESLVDQLHPDGKIVIPVGGPFETQYMVVATKNEKGKIREKKMYPVRFVPMTGNPEK
jgi:protein-L-isoaspartate(D-aspartate) O-methyltransferase